MFLAHMTTTAPLFMFVLTHGKAPTDVSAWYNYCQYLICLKINIGIILYTELEHKLFMAPV